MKGKKVMSDSNGNGSLVDNMLLMAGLMFLVYLLFLGIPIIPYLDLVISIVFSVFQPESLFGKLLTGAALFGTAYFMLEFVKAIGYSVFQDTRAMYMFLYAQGLFVIQAIGLEDERTFYFSKLIITIVSKGFNETTEMGAEILYLLSMVLFGFSFILELETRVKKIISNYRRSKSKE